MNKFTKWFGRNEYKCIASKPFIFLQIHNLGSWKYHIPHEYLILGITY